jgi:hypothetical protein
MSKSREPPRQHGRVTKVTAMACCEYHRPELMTHVTTIIRKLGNSIYLKGIGHFLLSTGRGIVGIGIRAVTRLRRLTVAEWKLCTDVFYASNLPSRDDVIITNGAGWDGRPFTVPNAKEAAAPVIGGLVSLIPSEIRGILGGGLGDAAGIDASFTIHIGPDFYDDLTATSEKDQEADASATLIHEMTHVWQGTNSTVAGSYMPKSLVNQARYGKDAYDYRPLKDWKSYNPEQQAQLVEDWYYQAKKRGGGESDERYPYIRDYVRRGIV